MSGTEREKKLLISQREYELLSALLPSCERYEQTNFYYDTETNSFNAERTTLRVRSKDGKLIGTLKRHKNAHMSEEELFQVTDVPSSFTIDGRYVVLKGSLCTHRAELALSEDVTLFLDINEYLETKDYELELEYGGDEAEARGAMLLLLAMLGRESCGAVRSKSERFFARLSAQSTEKEDKLWTGS